MSRWEERLGDSEAERFAHDLALGLEMAVIMQCQAKMDMAPVLFVPATKETFRKLGLKPPKNPKKTLQEALELLLSKRTDSGPGKAGIVAYYEFKKGPNSALDVFMVVAGYELMPPAFWKAYGVPSEPGWEAML